jgi:hypothetical protein
MGNTFAKRGCIAHFLGRSPAGRAIRCNLFAFQDKKISTAIPNAKNQYLNNV